MSVKDMTKQEEEKVIEMVITQEDIEGGNDPQNDIETSTDDSMYTVLRLYLLYLKLCCLPKTTLLIYVFNINICK